MVLRPVWIPDSAYPVAYEKALISGLVRSGRPTRERDGVPPGTAITEDGHQTNGGSRQRHATGPRLTNAPEPRLPEG